MGQNKNPTNAASTASPRLASSSAGSAAPKPKPNATPEPKLQRPKQLLNAPRFGGNFHMPPEEVSLVYDSRHEQYAECVRRYPDRFIEGVDIDIAKLESGVHAAHDPRVYAPLDEQMLLEFDERGPKVPIEVRAEGHRSVVIDGRQRVLLTRAVNAAIRARGGHDVKGKPVKEWWVKVLAERGKDDRYVVELAAALNAHRREDDPVTKGFRANEMLERGSTRAQVMQALKVKSWPTIEAWMKTLDLHADLKRAIIENRVSLNRALKVHGHPVEEQVALANSKTDEKPVRIPSRVWLVYHGNKIIGGSLDEETAQAELEALRAESKGSYRLEWVPALRKRRQPKEAPTKIEAPANAESNGRAVVRGRRGKQGKGAGSKAKSGRKKAAKKRSIEARPRGAWRIELTKRVKRLIDTAYLNHAKQSCTRRAVEPFLCADNLIPMLHRKPAELFRSSRVEIVAEIEATLGRLHADGRIVAVKARHPVSGHEVIRGVAIAVATSQ